MRLGKLLTYIIKGIGLTLPWLFIWFTYVEVIPRHTEMALLYVIAGLICVAEISFFGMFLTKYIQKWLNGTNWWWKFKHTVSGTWRTVMNYKVW